ncbi:hypothetical protein [Oxynema aestuarii]|uniref:Uncharacterized protein n=1 Tax=Oxynema aestuarii AP17 TaxID=2064643 RepID=A0A6H1U132_9CYAN|nr:hypothetical protein [Oxynema aestuarii]QIZ72572.1 hypothetical protein HCG48_19875 [Oxynema aestuarii AP17]
MTVCPTVAWKEKLSGWPPEPGSSGWPRDSGWVADCLNYIQKPSYKDGACIPFFLVGLNRARVVVRAIATSDNSLGHRFGWIVASIGFPVSNVAIARSLER